MVYSVGKALLGRMLQNSPVRATSVPSKSDTTCSVGVSCALVAQVDSMDTMPEMIYENTSSFSAHSFPASCAYQPSRGFIRHGLQLAYKIRSLLLAAQHLNHLHYARIVRICSESQKIPPISCRSRNFRLCVGVCSRMCSMIVLGRAKDVGHVLGASRRSSG